MNQELYCTMHCKALNVIFVSCFCETTHSVAFDTFRKFRKQFYVNSCKFLFSRMIRNLKLYKIVQGKRQVSRSLQSLHTNLSEQKLPPIVSALILHCSIKIKCRKMQIFDILGYQGCIYRLTCSHPELTEDHVLTSGYVKIFRTVTRNAVNKSV